MKKMNILFLPALLLTGIVACKNSTKEEAKVAATNVTTYVDSIQNLTPVYTAENWELISNGYKESALRAEKNLADLTAEDKQKLEVSKAKYAKLKESYEANIKLANEKTTVVINPVVVAPGATPVPDNRTLLRNRLFGEGTIGDDMKFSNVNAGNILTVYKNFVNTVADKKDNYSREDWDEIKVLYEALDNRKNAIEKDLPTDDNMKIAGLKIRFASIKGIHRTATKGPENEAAKD